jgi:hypothetical protein
MSEKYHLVESVGSRLLPIESYESAHIHHPSANATGLRTGRERDFERAGGSTSYPIIRGEYEEVRTVNGDQYVKKDMIFLENGSSNTQVPAPVQGYVYFTQAYGQASIYDKPKEQGGELIARVLHLKPETFQANSGSYIEYGQPMGIQGQTGKNGRPDPANYGIHVHIEFHTEHLDQFDRFIKDVNSGVIAPNKYPAQNQPNPFANPDNFGALETPSLSPVAQTLVQQSEQKVREACERYNQPWAEGMCNTSMALAVVAREAQMSGIDALGVSRDGIIYIEQTDRKGIYREAQINADEAANIPLAQSEQRLAIVDQQMLAQEQQQTIDNLAQTQHKVHSGPRMG